MKARDLSRLLASYVRMSDADCWPWTSNLSTKGYGQFFMTGRLHTAHRLVLELHGRAIPDGRVVDHLCRNRRCVNPRHLEPVTSRENTMRGETIAARNAAKSECPSGHPYSADNTKFGTNGGRYCRMCNRAYNKRRRIEQKFTDGLIA